MHARRGTTIGLNRGIDRLVDVAVRPHAPGAWMIGSFAAAAFIAAIPPALADVDPLSGIDFVRITHPGNAPWMGDGTEGDRAVGRGSVGYEYSIGRFEVTTAQWVSFFNAAYDRPAGESALPHLFPPTFWGAQGTTPINNSNPNARRWAVPSGNEMRPVGNISWRMAAMYCNFLHNGGAAAGGGGGGVVPRENFLNGAYDVSTFGYTGTVFTDQWAHHPDARYWIPTWDEHLKASHYDPSLNNGEGGWWRYNISSDTAPVYGPPGVMVNGQLAQANGLWDNLEFPGFSPFSIPLGAYSDVQSPWGLFDTAGGTKEWTEEVLLVNNLFPAARFFDGTAWASDGTLNDWIGNGGGDAPSFSFYDLGFRVASSVPAPGSSALVLGLGVILNQRRRK